MTSTNRPTGARLVFGVGLAIVLFDVAGVYVASARAVADPLAYGIAAVTAAVLGGSFLHVAHVHLFGAGGSGEKSAATRAAEVVFSITVLVLLTALAYPAGLFLAIVAALGGPDPRTADGEALRVRLLRWVERNREFMRTNGEGELPVTP